MKPWMDYLTRTSYLLQQGLFVGDVVYYYGDKGANFIPPKHTNTSLDDGYDYDVCNLEVMVSRMEVKDHKLTLPDGMSYEVLVLPEQNDITLEALKRIEELVKAGATVIGPKPEMSTGLLDHLENDAAVKALSDKLWGEIDGSSITENPYGQGKIIYGKTVNKVLSERNVSPDFQYAGIDSEADIDFIHRKTIDEEIYFLRNKNNSVTKFSGTFRVKDKLPELWFPDTGEREKQLVYSSNENGITLDLSLDKYASVFVVFSDDNDALHIQAISGENTVEKIENDTLFVTAYHDGLYEYTSSEGKTSQFTIEDVPAREKIQGEWDLSFLNKNMGAPGSTQTATLKSLSDFSIAGIKYYAGITRYEIEFELSVDPTSEEIRSFLNLGDLWLLADISLNGNFVGTLWKSPYQIEVTDFAIPGKNTLVVDIANTWCNRLIGDAQNPQDPPFCKTNIDGKEAAEGTNWKNEPLRRSGLFGPVEISFAKQQQILIN